MRPHLLLTYDFPPIGGGIARWMAELARRYPPGSLVVSTGLHPDAPDVDATATLGFVKVEIQNGTGNGAAHVSVTLTDPKTRGDDNRITLAESGAAFVVLTGSRDHELYRRAFDCGAAAVVLKDEPADVLLRRIERAHHDRARTSRP